MSIKSLGRRLDKLGPPGEWYDPTLAAQWNNATGARASELRSKNRPLTEDENQELAHLEACQKAWRRKHWPSEAKEDPQRERDHNRCMGLICEKYSRELTPSEEHELAELQARFEAERKAKEATGWRDPLQPIIDAIGKARDKFRSDEP